MDMKQNFLLLACISLLLTSCHKQQSATTDNSYPMITVKPHEQDRGDQLFRHD
jgi:outer membrane biogenesis lipoprotein LolB